ncbi:hypothetical protein TWF694_008263 [Orbilia ellipsospora]|uniref:Pentatricopeptide repeat protein n=1 Tax=Orbilia ellipsospora TaxID=2528407 RepID=A0AAV9XFK1_9PEZI
MARETQTTRALRDHAANLKAPSRRVLRYLRGIVDGRPYMTLPVRDEDLCELEELREMGLWPLQTCNGARKAKRKEREALDVCGLSRLEQDAVDRVVQGLQGRQPELRLDYEDTSVIGRNRRRALVAKTSQFDPRLDVPGRRGIHTDTRAQSRSIHTSAQLQKPSTLLTRSLQSPIRPSNAKRRKNDWQYKLAAAGRIRAEAEKNNNATFMERLHARPLTTAIDEDNRNLEFRSKGLLQIPAIQRLKDTMGSTKRSSLKREIGNSMKQEKYRLATHEFHSRIFNPELSIDSLNMCVDAHLRLGRVSKAEAVLERFKTGYKPTEDTMVLMLRILLARCKVDAAIHFVRMAHETASGIGTRLTKTLLEGIRQLGVEFRILKRVFELVENLLPTSQRIHYTILIRGCLDNRESDLAAEWLAKMEQAGHIADATTYNAILAGTAKHGAWERVNEILNLCRQKEIQISTQTMNTILNVAVDRPESSIPKLTALTELLKAEWNIATWNIMLKATILKTPAENFETELKSFFTKMTTAGYSPNHITVNTLLTKIEHTGDINPQALRRIITEITNLQTLAGSHLQDIVTGDMLSNTNPKNTTKIIRKDADNHQSQDTTLRMIALLRELKPIEALRIFNAHISQSLRPTTTLLIHAIKAVHLIPATPTTFEDEQLKYNHAQYKSHTLDQILSLSASHGLDVHASLSPQAWAYLSAVYAYKLNKNPKAANQTVLRTPPLEETLSEIYGFYRKHDIGNPHQPLMVSMSVLYTNRKYRTIVDLMRKVVHSEHGRLEKFDIVALTILLKAYVSLRDEKGVRWVADQVVDKGVEPDEVFMKILRGEKKVPRAEYVKEWSAEERESVVESIKMCEQVMEEKRERREKNQDMIIRLLKDCSDSENKKIKKKTKLKVEEVDVESDAAVSPSILAMTGEDADLVQENA